MAFMLAALTLGILLIHTRRILSKDVDTRIVEINRNMECKNSLDEMSHGHWISRIYTKLELYEVERFLTTVRGAYFIPTTLSRPDGNCGNVSFDFLKKLGITRLLFRSLCDPQGPSPCCYENRCVDLSMEQCSCNTCWDMRQPLNAELATWIPDNPQCHVAFWDLESACELLDGASLYFVGDSFLRHVYTAMAAILSGNYRDATLKADMAKGRKNYCSGWMQLWCYNYITYQIPVCDGRTSIIYKELLVKDHGKIMLEYIKYKTNVAKTFFFVGLGIHGNFNSEGVWNDFLYPVVEHLKINSQQNMSWPEFVWLSAHAPGMLKTPRIPQQNYESVKKYNKFINKRLEEARIPVFDTFSMTDGMMSYDGAHYGFAMNQLKSQIILNYLNELKSSGKW